MKRSAFFTLMLLLVFIFPEFAGARAGGAGGRRSRSSSRRRRSVRRTSSHSSIRERRARRRRELYSSRRTVVRRLNRLVGLNRVVVRLKYIALQMDRQGKTREAAALRAKIRQAEEKIYRNRTKLYSRQRYLDRQISTYGY